MGHITNNYCRESAKRSEPRDTDMDCVLKKLNVTQLSEITPFNRYILPVSKAVGFGFLWDHMNSSY